MENKIKTRPILQDWIKYNMDRLNNGLMEQGETPAKYFRGGVFK